MDAEIKEISITKVKGDEYWQVWTSDGVEINRLQRKGWVPDGESGPYMKFNIPAKALNIRSKKVVENMEKRSEEMKGKKFGKGNDE